MNFIRFARTSISSQSQEIHRLTSLPFQWVLSFPKDPRAEWGCRKKYPNTIRVCRITKGLPTLFTPDEPNYLQSPPASAFSHPSNIRVKKTPFIQTLPFHLYRSFFLRFMHNVKLLFLFILILDSFLFYPIQVSIFSAI